MPHLKLTDWKINPPSQTASNMSYWTARNPPCVDYAVINGLDFYPGSRNYLIITYLYCLSYLVFSLNAQFSCTLIWYSYLKDLFGLYPPSNQRTHARLDKPFEPLANFFFISLGIEDLGCHDIHYGCHDIHDIHYRGWWIYGVSSWP